MNARPTDNHKSPPRASGAAEAAAGADRRPAVVRWLNRLGPLLALIVVYAAFAIAEPAILRGGAVEQIVTQAVLVGTAAIGMTLVIIAAGIDLSVGSLIALSSVIAARLLADAGLSPGAAVLGAIAAGALCGLGNGMVIVFFRITPFIVTLGTMLAFRGLAKGLAGSRPVDVDPEAISALMAKPSGGSAWLMLPIAAWIMLGLTALAAGFLRYARLGRHVVAVGSNEQTARLCGVRVEMVKLMVYSAVGAAAGLSGVFLVSLQTQGDPTGAQAMELEVIAAVVIGGGSLSGGQGSALGALVGALIMSVIKTGCTFVGWDPWVQQIATGLVIVIAVAVDRLRHRRAT